MPVAREGRHGAKVRVVTGGRPADYDLAAPRFLNTFQVEVANAINVPSADRASAFKNQVPPRRIASPRQITRPLLTGARYCTFNSNSHFGI